MLSRCGIRHGIVVLLEYCANCCLGLSAFILFIFLVVYFFVSSLSWRYDSEMGEM